VDNPSAGVITWTSNGTLAVSGNLSLPTGMVNSWTGTLTMNATSGTKTITTNGIILQAITLNGSGGTFQLIDNLKLVATFTNTAGTLDATTNSRTVTLNATNTFVIPTAPTTFYNLSIIPLSPTLSDAFRLDGDITISGTFTISDGATVTNRVFVRSNTKGTQRTITATAISIANADFLDIIGAGAATWDMSAATGGSGNCGNNSMKALGNAAFTSPVTTNYTGGTGNWSTIASWGTRVPLPQDTATFTTAGTVTITQDMPRIGSVDFSTSANKTWTTSISCSFFGSIDLTNLTTLTASSPQYTYEGRGSSNLNSGGKTWAKSMIVNAPSGTLTLKSNFTNSVQIQTSNGTLTVVDGANNWVISTPIFLCDGGTLTLGSAIHLITGTSGTTWRFNVGATLNANTSTLKFTDTANGNITFTGGGATYNNVYFSRGASTGNITISGNNTFADFKDDGSIAHSILFTAASTQTFTTFTVSGTAGQLITLNSTTTGTYTLTAPSRSNLSPVSCDYLDIYHSVATQANTWYAGVNSNSTHQATATAGSGWIFTAPAAIPNSTASFLLLMM
jgi:hypothetical protein